MASAPQCSYVRDSARCMRQTTRASGLCFQHDPTSVSKKDAQLRALDEIADELNAWGNSTMSGNLDDLAEKVRRVRRELAGEPPLTPPQPQE